MNVVDSSGRLEYFANATNAKSFAKPILDTEHLVAPPSGPRMRISRASKACAISHKPGADTGLADGFRAARLIRTFMTDTDKGSDFVPYVETLCTRHKAKRNFMQRLEGVAAEKAAKRVTRRTSE